MVAAMATTPRISQSSCRSKNSHAPPYTWSASTEEADSTMIRPRMHSSPTTTLRPAACDHRPPVSPVSVGAGATRRSGNGHPAVGAGGQEVGVEQAQGEGGEHQRQNPEADDHGRLRPPHELEV